MNLESIIDFSFLQTVAPLVAVLVIIAAVLPSLRRPGRERLFFVVLGAFFLGAAGVFLIMGQLLSALSVFLVPLLLGGFWWLSKKGRL